MDAWALRYAEQASFVCVCCAGPQLAAQFAKELKLKACTNVWVEEDDMPLWGQLGCNGFIILDAQHQVVRQSTSAYLEVRELAFRQVESLLAALISQQPLPRVTPGEKVIIRGLVAKPELNGKQGLCTSDADESGRYKVVLPRGKNLSVKGDNLELVSGELAGVQEERCGESCSDKQQCSQVQSDGCTEERCRTSKRPLEELANDDSLKVPSVQNDALDAEHARCTAALQRLARERTVAAALNVFEEYKAHFEHEEQLLDRYLYCDGDKQDGGSGFSADRGARKSHFADHKALLDGVRALTTAEPVSPNAISALFDEFERHATQYDVSYAERLSAALVAAAS